MNEKYVKNISILHSERLRLIQNQASDVYNQSGLCSSVTRVVSPINVDCFCYLKSFINRLREL